MRTRTKILITILLAVLYFALVQHFNDNRLVQTELPSARSKADLPSHLDWWNEGFNSEYFGDKLPKDIVIDWNERDDHNMATTTTLPDGRFHIALNEKYCLATRIAHVTLLHEDCHVLTFSEVEDGKEHGPRWKTCMVNLSQQHAFENELIDDK
jgi:hypothetical protein